MTQDELAKAWVTFLQDLAMAQEYPALYQVSGSAVGRNPLLEELLPSLLFIRLVSLADEGLEACIDLRGITCSHPSAKGSPKHQKGDLYNRTRCLEDSGLLSPANASALDRLRDRRKGLAHDGSPASAAWSEVDTGVDDVEGGLLELGLIHQRLRYTAEAFQSKAQDSQDPAVLFEQVVGIMVRRDGEPIKELRWTLEWSKDQPEG